jgi:hypothetical protein
MASLIAGGTPGSMGLYMRLACAAGMCIHACALCPHVARSACNQSDKYMCKPMV